MTKPEPLAWCRSAALDRQLPSWHAQFNSGVSAVRPRPAALVRGILGRQLLREEAWKHPLKAQVFRVIDQRYPEDEVLAEFFVAVAARHW